MFKAFSWCLPHKRWGDFNSKKLKLLEGSVFSSYEGVSPYGRHDNGNQRGHNSFQNNYHTIIFFQGKVTFPVTFKEKIVFNFKRTISTQTEAATERCSGK